MTDPADRSATEPVWRVPKNPLPRPRGKRYRLQIPPERRRPVPDVADAGGEMQPAVLGVAAGALANRLRVAIQTPADSWVVEVLRRETRVAGRQAGSSETLPTPDSGIDRAFVLAERIRRGSGRVGWWRK